MSTDSKNYRHGDVALIPTPIECSGERASEPGFCNRMLILTEPWELMAWELYGNPDQKDVLLELEVRAGGYGQFPDRMQTVMRPAILQGNKSRFPIDGAERVLQDWPTGLVVGIWVMKSNTPYFLLNLLRKSASQPSFVRLQPPQRIPLPGEGETWGES